ncbi:MAG TPA: RidA family protein [Steroidobacteraceae bacterium]
MNWWPTLILQFAALDTLAGCAAWQAPAQRSCFHRSERIETEIGYCQAVRSGNTLHVSGIAGEGKMDLAVRSVYDRLRQTLTANGLSFADVVKENVYTTDLDAFIGTREIRKDYYGSTLPAATWVQVQRLYLPSFVVEIEVTAEHRQ